MKILIAGSGIAGSVLARQLRSAGHEVLLVDGHADLAASRCAFAYLRLDWFHGPERNSVRYALDWYRSMGALVTTQAWVVDGRRGSFRQRGHYLVHPTAPLLAPDVPRDVYNYRSGPAGVWAVLDGTSTVYQADHLVFATGAGTDRWGTGTPTYGGIFECRDYTMSEPLRLLRVTDRMTHVAADDGAVVRVGSSKGNTPTEAKQRAERILERMMDEGMITSTRKWTYRAGVRWTNLAGGPGPSLLDTRVWTFTGFSRTGYALVPAAARDFITTLERS